MKKNIDIKLNTDKLNGIFRGVVELNVDPLKLGRVKVRVWGVHTDLKVKNNYEGVPTDDLPWAEQACSITEGSVSGYGLWSIPLQGSHVFVFFENGDHRKPVYFATVPGIPENAPDGDEGFNDPDEVYPTSDTLGEPDLHRLSREISDDTIVDTKTSNRDIGVTTVNNGSWDEPEPYYDAEYPHNIVFATHGGLIYEIDSTPGSRRFHLYHPSNTYIEINEAGEVVISNASNKYEVVVGNKKVHVKGVYDITVDGNCSIKAKNIYLNP